MKWPRPPVRFQGARGRSCTLRMPMPRKTGMPSDSIKASYGVGCFLNSPKPALRVPAGLCQWVCSFSCGMGVLAWCCVLIYRTQFRNFCKARSFDHIIPASVNRRRRRRAPQDLRGAWRKEAMRWKHSIVLLQALCVGFAGAQSPEKNQAVYLYEGGDRAHRLPERARQEGALTIYTSLATSESVPLTQAFERKYGVKVELWRSLSDQVVRRALNEAKARRHVVDVIETNAPELEALARERVLARFFSPHIADIPQWGVPAHRMWIADRVDFFVVAFNTARVRREELPATYEGFLDPRWKGRIGLEATDQEWLAGVAKHWGERRALEVFRGLVAIKPDVRKGHVVLSEMVSAGGGDAQPTHATAHAQFVKRKGETDGMEPVEA